MRVIRIAGAQRDAFVGDETIGPGGATAASAQFNRYYGPRRVARPIRSDMQPLGDDAATAAATSTAVQQADAAMAQAQANLDSQNKDFKRDMMQAAAKVAAVQTAASVSVMIVGLCIPVIGWAMAAVAAIMSIVSSALGKKYKAEVKQIIADLQTRLNAYQQAAQDKVHAAEQAMATQLWPAAQQLAASGQDLGDFWSDLRDDIKHAAKQVVTAVVKFHTEPVKFIGSQAIKGIRSFAGAVHDTNLQKKLKGKEDAWADEIDRSAQHTAAAMTNLNTLKDDAIHAVNIATGKEQVIVAQQKAADIEKAAKAQIDAYVQQALAGLQTPEYQTELTRDLARAIRGDPSLMQEATYYQEQEQALAVKNGLPASTVVPTVKTSTLGGNLAAVAALAGAFLLLKHR